MMSAHHEPREGSAKARDEMNNKDPARRADASAEPLAEPAAVSVFVMDPAGLPERMDSPFWKALPGWSGLRPPEGLAPVGADTEFRIAHDAERLAFFVSCEEPEPARLWTRRTSALGRLDLDDSIEIRLDPYHAHGFLWTFRLTPRGEWEAVLPVGACAVPECHLEVRTGESSWEALLTIPLADLGLEGDLRGTPADGEAWGLALIRRRREEGKGKPAGARQVGVWASERAGESPGPEDLGHIRFQGGRARPPVEFTKYAAGGFGVNEICVAFGGGRIPEGAEVTVRPNPAKFMRSKDISRTKFRVYRPGLYRYLVRIPYAPPPEPTEKDVADLEREAGRELTEDEIADVLASRPGEPAYAAGLSFTLQDVWLELEEMEDRLAGMHEALKEAGLAPSAETEEKTRVFEEARDAAERYRMPHAKDRLQKDRIEKLRASFRAARAGLRRQLLEAGKLALVNPYDRGGEWHAGVLRVRTTHSEGGRSPEELVRAFKKAGLDFCAFADRPEGGDQNGDGKHDWSGDGEVSTRARRLPSGRAVFEGRGREAYLRDYSRSAARQGKPWVKENWKLSVPGDFVVLRAVEVGSHIPALCIGPPAGPLPRGAHLGYELVERTVASGGFAVMCDTPADLQELPAELLKVAGTDASGEVWDRMLSARLPEPARGRSEALPSGGKFFFFPAGLIGRPPASGGEFVLPERTALAVVLSKEHTEEAIIEALRRGSFYSTTGPRIKEIRTEGASLTISTEDSCQIFFRSEGGKVLGGAFGTEATYEFAGEEKYIRAVCLAEVLEDGFQIKAETQPFFVADPVPPGPARASGENGSEAEA